MPLPLHRQGSSLAVIGAYILARKLGRHGDDHSAAFADPEAQRILADILNAAKVAIDIGA